MKQDAVQTNCLEVFVLGAGFSKGFVDTAPLVRGFLGRISKELLTEDRFSHLRRFANTLGIDDSALAEVDLERLLTYASIAPRWLDKREASELSLVREEIVEAIVEVMQRSFRRQETCFPENAHNPADTTEGYQFETNAREALGRFGDHLISGDGRRHVISFNYDLLLENELEFRQRHRIMNGKERARRFRGHMASSPWFHIGVSYGFRPNVMVPTGVIRPSQRGPFPTDISVLKLHGSMNWRARRGPGLPIHANDVLAMHVYYDFETVFPNEHRASTSEFDSQPFIVPPTLDKGVIGMNPVLNVVWHRAARLLSSAERIVFIGYSMPETDFYSEFLFRYHTPVECSLVVVGDPNCDEAWEERLLNRYKAVFGKRDIDWSLFRKGAVKYCEEL